MEISYYYTLKKENMLSKLAIIFLCKHTVKHLVRTIGLDRISLDMSLIATYQRTLGLVSNRLSDDILQLIVWYDIVEFNVPLDTV